MKKRLTSTLNNDIMIIPSKPVKAVIKLKINQPLTLINVHRNKDYIMCGKNMEDKLVLKNNLKEIRCEQELSQRQPADMTGVSRNTIGSIEVGEFRPTAKPTLVLSSALDKLNGKRGGLFAPFCLLVAVLVLVLASCEKTPQDTSDVTPPVIEGTHDIEILQGDGIAYREGVSAHDDCDGEVLFWIDASAVDPETAGIYTVTYHAKDSAGNEASVSVKVTVRERLVTYAELWAEIDPIIAAQGFRTQSVEQLCETLYWYLKANMKYNSTSDKSDWVAEAYRALTERLGDCFTYYAVARAFFERLGISVITVQRSAGVLETTHYWLLVNTGSEAEPTWYHWDVCPHPMEYPLTSILLTDDELLAYNEKVEHYYTFDRSLYPATPIE